MPLLKIEPAIIDITMPMAVTNTINYTFAQKDGAPIDISNSTLYFTAKDVASDNIASDSSAKIKKELTITNGLEGKAKLFLTQDDSFIDAGDYYYDIKILTPHDGDNTTVDAAVIGKFVITSTRTNRVTEV